MGRESKVVKDRTCKNCGDIINGTAKDVMVHSIECSKVKIIHFD